MENKEKVSLTKREQQQKIKNERDRILKRNHEIKKIVKSNILDAEASLQQTKRDNTNLLKENIRAVSFLNRIVKQKKVLRNNSIQTKAESDYLIKMEEEKKYQKQALCRINFLENLEENLMESSKKPIDFEQLLTSELLSCINSPSNNNFID